MRFFLFNLWFLAAGLRALVIRAEQEGDPTSAILEKKDRILRDFVWGIVVFTSKDSRYSSLYRQSAYSYNETGLK